MSENAIHLSVYGAEVKCASCVNAPGSKETFEWLQAAISRKYYDEQIHYHYFDIHEENNEEADMEIIQQIRDEEWFYPLVLVEDEIVADGNPRLKTIFKSLENKGLQLRDEVK